MYSEFYDSTERSIEKEMHRRSATVESKLCEIVHPKYVNEFASIIRVALLEELPAADIIASVLDLSIIDFFAYENETEIFSKLYLEEIQKERETIAFERYIDELAG